mmetsp:Transcript_85797/g.199419  ORF Transcript_85797/g.199419 Transcript_85797/m.199419 type:complete len:487 (+) Transcript_85797:43-1503(+)
MFSAGIGIDGLAAATDDYLKAKFAKAKPRPGPTKRKVKVKARIPVTAPEPEDLVEAERELLGKTVGGFTAAVAATEEPSSVPSVEPERLPDVINHGLAPSIAAATRLAAPGSQHSTSRSCPEGHPLMCYVVGWSAALCDECDFMQKPGQVVFGCQSCESEICAQCIIRTAGSEQAVQEGLRVISAVAESAGAGASRFVATPSGAVLGTLPSSCYGQEAAVPNGTLNESVQQQQQQQQPPQSSTHPARGSDDIDDSSWKQPSKVQPRSRGYMLSEMIAEQENIIQECGLILREAKEAEEQCRVGSQPGGTRTPGVVPSTSPPGAGHAAEKRMVDSPCQPGIDLDLNLMDENAARSRPQWAVEGRALSTESRAQPLQRSFDLTLTLVGDFVDELARGYSQPWFQHLVQECARACGYNRKVFLVRLQDVAFEVQKPILENWGFDGDEQGVYDMTSILCEHSRGAPPWLQEKVDRCLTLLYGGQMAGMLA